MYYIVEVNLIGASKSLSFSDPSSQRILTSIFRLNRHQKAKLQYIKVKLYRRLRELSSFSIDDKYVLNAKKLPEFDKAFSEVYSDFKNLRKEIFEELRKEWPKARQAIEAQLKRAGYEDKLELLDGLEPPKNPRELVELRYKLIPLNFLLNVSELIDDEQIKKRMEKEAYRIRKEIEKQYREKIRELEEKIRNLLKELNEKEQNIKKLRKLIRTKEYYLAKLEKLIPDVDDASQVLGEETADELKERLEAVKMKLMAIQAPAIQQ